jgi:hypothetical protein
MPVVYGREHLTLVALTLNPSPNSGRGTLSSCSGSPSPNIGRRRWGMRATGKTEVQLIEKPTYGFTNHLKTL